MKKYLLGKIFKFKDSFSYGHKEYFVYSEDPTMMFTIRVERTTSPGNEIENFYTSFSTSYVIIKELTSARKRNLFNNLFKADWR
jgi:hypothetical protein